mgnify:CR=1 FL=1
MVRRHEDVRLRRLLDKKCGANGHYGALCSVFFDRGCGSLGGSQLGSRDAFVVSFGALPGVFERQFAFFQHEAVCRQLFHRERVGEWKGLVVADAFPAEDEVASFLYPMFIAQCGHVDGCRLSAAFEAETLVFVGHAGDGFYPSAFDVLLAEAGGSDAGAQRERCPFLPCGVCGFHNRVC